MTRVDLTPAFVLHRRPYRNTSLIVDLLTQEHGRISVVAKSARGPKSRYKDRLQPFIPLLASWAGRNDLKALNQLEHRAMPYALKGQALLCGFYVNELVLRLFPQDNDMDNAEQFFLDYQQCFISMIEFNNKIEQALRIFEKKLLQALGYALPLQYEIDGVAEIHRDRFYRYLPESGFMCCVFSGSDPMVFSGQCLLNLANEHLDDSATLTDIKRLLRMALRMQLGDRPLQSRKLFETVGD